MVIDCNVQRVSRPGAVCSPTLLPACSQSSNLTRLHMRRADGEKGGKLVISATLCVLALHEWRV